MKPIVKIKLLLIINLLLCTSTICAQQIASQSATYENLGGLRAEVKKFLQQQYLDAETPPEISIKNLDNRLRLKKCSIAPEYSIKSGSRKYGHVTVFTECKGTTPWSLYVPATVTGYQYVLVAKQGIFRGTIISKQHLQLKKIDLSKAYYGFYTDSKQILGLQASRSIPTGSIISKLFLELPDIIKEGQEIFIQAKTQGINVQLKGKALNDGKLGQLIRVRNTASGKVIQAKVISSTKVEVSLD